MLSYQQFKQSVIMIVYGLYPDHSEEWIGFYVFFVIHEIIHEN